MLKIREHIKIHVGLKTEDKLPAVKGGKKQKIKGKTEADPEGGGMSRGTAMTVLGLWRSRRQEEAEEEEVQVRASNEGSRRFYNHGECLYWGIFQV